MRAPGWRVLSPFNSIVLAFGLVSLPEGPTIAQVVFSEVAQEAGVAVIHDPLGYRPSGFERQDSFGPAAAWADLNQDGWPDLIVTNGETGNYGFLNNGDGSFSELSAVLGLRREVVVSNGVAVGDMNNDDYPDICIANFHFEPHFYPGRAGSYLQLARNYGLDPLMFNEGQGPDPWLGPESMGVSWGDYNRDGYLDLYVANYFFQSDILLENRQGGLFVRTQIADITELAYGFQALFWDFDDDGDQDIYVANDFGRNFLLENQGPNSGWEFVDKAALYKVGGGGGFPAPQSMSMGLAAGDYDNDLDLDLYVTNYIENSLFENTGEFIPGAWRFRERSVEAGVDFDLNCWGTDFFDADLDGDLDLAMVGGWLFSNILPQPVEIDNRMWLNDGAPNWTFTDVTAASGFSDMGLARALAVADYDRDGDLDMLVTHNTNYEPNANVPDAVRREGRVKLYRNDTVSSNHWLNLFLIGGGDHGESGCNRSAIGARVYLTVGGRTQMREIQVSSSYMSQHSLELEFGLGSATAIEELRVRWICGDEEQFSGALVDGFYRLEEGTGTAVVNAPAIVRFAAAPREGHVELELDIAPWLQSATLSVERAVDMIEPQFEPTALQLVPQGGGARVLDEEAREGVAYVYRVKLEARERRVSSTAVTRAVAGATPTELPRRPELTQNFPNPFNPGTRILYSLPRDMAVRLILYDARGRRVATLYEGPASAGPQHFDWDGTGEDGRRLASGVYHYALETEDGSSTRSLTVVR